jgi:hypothetical protein
MPQPSTADSSNWDTSTQGSPRSVQAMKPASRKANVMRPSTADSSDDWNASMDGSSVADHVPAHAARQGANMRKDQHRDADVAKYYDVHAHDDDADGRDVEQDREKIGNGRREASHYGKNNRRKNSYSGSESDDHEDHRVDEDEIDSRLQDNARAQTDKQRMLQRLLGGGGLHEDDTESESTSRRHTPVGAKFSRQHASGRCGGENLDDPFGQDDDDPFGDEDQVCMHAYIHVKCVCVYVYI